MQVVNLTEKLTLPGSRCVLKHNRNQNGFPKYVLWADTRGEGWWNIKQKKTISKYFLKFYYKKEKFMSFY